jgi:ATP-dependent HslUV protease ATP-binding subunit HslU
VEQIIRDLVDAAQIMVRENLRDEVKAKAHDAAEERVIEALAGEAARDQTRDMFRKKLRSGELDDTIIELEVTPTRPTRFRGLIFRASPREWAGA